jgi:hypothetical protein
MWRDGTAYVDAGQQAYEQQYRDRVLTNLQRKAKALGYKLIQVEDPDSVQAAATRSTGEVPGKLFMPLHSRPTGRN